MFIFSSLYRSKTDNKFYISDENGELHELEERFSIDEWDSAETYANAKIRGYEPMTANELEDEESQDPVLNSKEYFIEEKFDGTRGILQFFSQESVRGDEVGYCRLFSRRISKKTGFYAENTDLVPQLREINVPEMKDTILDGELFINGRPFKDVSSTMNCLWDKAIDRQLELGFVSFHAFDIIKYKGVDLRKMPLERRKVYLHLAIEEIDSPYVEKVVYQSCGGLIDTTPYESTHGTLSNLFDRVLNEKLGDTYPHFYDEMCEKITEDVFTNFLTPRAFYEYLVATGGEGVIIKPKNGTYKHKRGWEYSKIKSFLTREMILIGFSEPTKEYTGKNLKDWAYYEGKTPVTRHYYNNQVGNMKLGVILTEDELNSIPKAKRGNLYQCVCAGIYYKDDCYIMEVCECAGFSDSDREYFTKNKDKMVGRVVEVKANDIMKNTGRLRHPRYLRMRPDKNAEDCTWKDHVR